MDSRKTSQTFHWTMDAEMESRLSKKRASTKPGEQTTRPMVQPGSLIYRLRSVKVTDSSRTPKTGNEWVVQETTWPPHIFIEVNKQVVEVRRKIAWGKDLPADITSHVQAGSNELKVVCLSPGKQQVSPTFVMAIEIYECLSEDSIIKDVKHIPLSDAKSSVLSRLSGASDTDDMVLVESDRVSLAVRCPLSFTLLTTPVRGVACKHLECFDLQNYLETRPRRKDHEPPFADSWRCPLCRGDARPTELVVDDFLASVLQELMLSRSTDVQNIVVKRDGGWEPIRKEEEKKDGGKVNGAVEIICLDD